MIRARPALILLSLIIVLGLTPIPATAFPIEPSALTFQTTGAVRTGSDRLNVREAPSSTSPIIGKLYNGTVVTINGRDASDQWLLIDIPGTTGAGWVSAAYVVPTDAGASAPAPTPIPAATPLPGKALPRAQSGLSGSIAVPIFHETERTYDIYLFDVASRQFSKAITEASQPALSRDGRFLAHHRWKTDDRGVVVTDLADGSSLRVTNFLEDVLPSWSVDGTQLVFSSYRHPDHGKRKSRLYWLWADANRDWVFTRGPDAVYGEDPFWMNDGRIVFRRRQPTGGLYIMDRQGWDDRLIMADDTALAPAVSPDDRTILFMSKRDGNWDLYRMNLNGSSLRRLTTHAADDGLPAWSPDGRRIAWVSNRGGAWALWVMDAHGGNKRRLATLPGSVDGRVEFEPEYLTHGWLEEQISWGP